MAILRKIKKTDYTIIDNNIFRNKQLSLKGKGMICTMLSLPDEWEFSEIGLTQLSNDSRTSIRSTLKELMDYGYLVRERNRDEKGILRDITYTIYEEPMYQNPTLEKPTLEKRHNKILNILNTNNINNNTNTLFDLLQENGFKLTPLQIEQVSLWEDTELTRYAIKKAVLNNKFNVSYIDKILSSYKVENITTVQQAIEADEAFELKRNNFYKTKYQNKETRYEREMKLLEYDDEE